MTLRNKLGCKLASLQLADSSMDYYLKLYSYFELNKVVGLSAPQGSGKSTIARVMQYLFELDGKSCVYVSLDDLYHTFDTQQKIAKEYPENPLLQVGDLYT